MDGSFFGFHSRPFAAAPVVDNYFPARAIETARQNLIRVIVRAEGPGLVVGAAGLGKSLLCRLLAAYFADSFDVVMLSSAKICTRKALLQSILFELNLPYRNLEEGELRLGLLDFLQPGQSKPRGMLLIVDEAHSLPLRLLDEVRMITNLVRDGQPRARLILAGNPKLDERFAHPKLESFNQRLAARCYLEPLTYDETLSYVRSQIRKVGGDPDAVFRDDAFQAIHRASDGIPRLINQICDHALLLAEAGGRRELDATSVGEAWADLQQLPVPWYDHDARPAADVEFGQLEDLEEHPDPDVRVDTELGFAPDEPLRESERESFADGDEALWATTSDVAMALYDTTWPDVPEPELPVAEPVEVMVGEPGVPEEAVFQSEALLQLQAGDPRDEQPAPPVEEENPPNDPPRLGHQQAETSIPFNQDNPFGEAFDEEEIVIDRYAALEIEAFRGRPQVLSEESHTLAAALSKVKAAAGPAAGGEKTGDNQTGHETQSPLVLEELPADEEAAGEVRDSTGETVFDDSVVDLHPEPHPGSDLGDRAVAEAPGAGAPDLDPCCFEFPSSPESGEDDRDLIILDDPESGPGELTQPESADEGESPQDYQALFAQLRKA